MAETEVWEVVSGFRDEVANLAEVEERQLTDRLRSIKFRPTNPEAAGVWLAVSEREVIVELGRGARFEIGVDEADRRLLGELLQAAVAGRVEERTRRLWLVFRVWLSDGTVKAGCVMARGLGGKRATRRYARGVRRLRRAPDSGLGERPHVRTIRSPVAQGKGSN